MQGIPCQKGFSLLEVLVVVACLTVLAGIALPLLLGPLQRARARGAAEALGAAIRDARGRAAATGWQYRVVAFAPTGTVANAFRIEGADPATGPTWPLATSQTPPVFYGATQMYEAYNNLTKDFVGAQFQIPGGGSSFVVTFDSRGQLAIPCVPAACQVQVSAPGSLATLTVSQAGAVLLK